MRSITHASILFLLSLPYLASSDAVKRKLQRGEKVELEIVANAIDGDFNSQPQDVENTWNVLGICCNHWARTKVTVDPEKNVAAPVIAPRMPEAGTNKWPCENPGFQYKADKKCGPDDFVCPGNA
jgi:hypothetical protein